MAKNKGPKREDGYQLSGGESAVMEQRGYLDEDGGVEIYTFVAGTNPERLVGLGPRTVEGLRRWFRELDQRGT